MRLTSLLPLHAYLYAFYSYLILQRQKSTLLSTLGVYSADATWEFKELGGNIGPSERERFWWEKQKARRRNVERAVEGEALKESAMGTISQEVGT